MALGAVLASALTTHAAKSKALWVAGVDVLDQPGQHGYGVTIGSVSLTEAGPGDVSSLQFVISDTASQITLAEGQPVAFWDLTNDAPLFTGWVQTWNTARYGIGRRYMVTCIGVEAILDWLKVPSLTIPAGTDEVAAIQAAVGAATGIGVQLRAVTDGTFTSSPASPLESATTTLGYAVTLTGVTLREAIRLINAARTPNPGGTRLASVDFYFGLRSWTQGTGALTSPTDYAILSIRDDWTGPNRAANLDYAFDGSGAVHHVYVQGGSAAGSGLFTDGSGIPGDVPIVTDSTSTTAAQAAAIGASYLAEQGAVVRGSFDLEGYAPVIGPATVRTRAGGTTTIVDTQAGLNLAQFRVFAIDKVFYGNGLEDWHISFGGHPPSALRLVRRLTRAILS